MPRHGTAHQRLRRELGRRGLAYRDAVAALALPAHFTHLHKIAQGKREPDLGLALAIERELGVQVEEWPSLRPAVEELLQRRRTA